MSSVQFEVADLARGMGLRLAVEVQWLGEARPVALVDRGSVAGNARLGYKLAPEQGRLHAQRVTAPWLGQPRPGERDRARRDRRGLGAPRDDRGGGAGPDPRVIPPALSPRHPAFPPLVLLALAVFWTWPASVSDGWVGRYNNTPGTLWTIQATCGRTSR